MPGCVALCELLALPVMPNSEFGKTEKSKCVFFRCRGRQKSENVHIFDGWAQVVPVDQELGSSW
jgi:hypothetical protein